MDNNYLANIAYIAHQRVNPQLRVTCIYTRKCDIVSGKRMIVDSRMEITKMELIRSNRISYMKNLRAIVTRANLAISKHRL